MDGMITLGIVMDYEMGLYPWDGILSGGGQ